MLNSGAATPVQIRGWVANRFYYQISIPIKDAAILANCPDRSVRRNWVQRILDHDGYGDDPGGIESWLRLAEAVGLERKTVESLAEVLPGVRFAVDAYVNFARRAPWPEAICSSLTELFAPEIHKQRLANWPQHYPWIDRVGIAILPEPGELGSPRRRVRPRRDAGAFQYPRPAGARARDSEIQARRAVADERCHGTALHGEVLNTPAVDIAFPGLPWGRGSACNGSPRKMRTCFSIRKG